MGFMSHLHGKEHIETDKLQALREYLFLVETNNASIDRVECHEKIETLWETGKDNKFLRYILHNLDVTIGLIIDRELSYKEKVKFENKLKNLLDKVKDWKKEDEGIDIKLRIKKGNTS